jgi:hypothetical protein
MPGRVDMLAATPKCPCAVADGPEESRCWRPMRWHDDRRVWVCPAHQHMEVRPDDLSTPVLAPKQIRDRLARVA